MLLSALTRAEVPDLGAAADSMSRADRLEQLCRDNFDFVWRLARHLGLSQSDADDVAQRVMMVAASRFDAIESGKERAFLYQTTVYATMKMRRTWGRRREILTEDFPEEQAPDPQPDELLDKQRAYADLRRILQQLPDKVRTAFVLYELEGWTLSEIATAQSIPQFTVASRVRRARQQILRRCMGLKNQMKGNRP